MCLLLNLFRPKPKKKFVPKCGLKGWTEKEKAVFRQLDDYLTKNNINIALWPEKQLMLEARKRCYYMHKIGKMTHDGHQENFKRLKKLGLNGLKEILAINIYDPKELLEAWLASPSHKKALTYPKNRFAGVAVYDRYACVIFGR